MAIDPAIHVAADPQAETFGATGVRVDPDEEGGWLVCNTEPLEPYPANVGHWIRTWAGQRPSATFIAEFDGIAWRTWSWEEARLLIDQLSAALLNAGLGPDKPVAMLSDKCGRSGLLTFAAMQVGVPVAPLSPNWSRLEAAEARLRHALAVVQPGMVIAADAKEFDRAVDVCRSVCPGATVVDLAGASGDLDWESLRSAAASTDGDAGIVEPAFEAVTPETVGKIMFTSGSTGLPKAVQVTHGNMTSNQQALRQMLPFLQSEPPVVVDWQPWHHCGGGCYNWHAAVANGGSYYCDPGRPTRDGIALTAAALRGLSPTLHFNVPVGYDLLFQVLAEDEDLKVSFFKDLRLLIYSAASMPTAVWESALTHARSPDGAALPMVSAYGMTEMAPMHTMVAWPMDQPNQIGIPAPGCDVRLVPFVDEAGAVSTDRYELQAKGPNIAPGYHADPAATKAGFTEDGWYRSGDLVRFSDPEALEQGLRLDGRVVEQFKLATGTWVSVNELRLDLVAALQPYVRDAVITGHGRHDIGALLIPVDGMSVPGGDWESWIATRLADFNLDRPGSSRRVDRAALIEKPLSIAVGEVTDKGSINQRMALENREDEVQRLYGNTG